MDFVKAFPEELSYKIFYFLDHESFQYAGLVCQKWRDLTQDETLQKSVYYELFNFGRDPEFFHEKPLSELKAIRKNFKSWNCKLITLKADEGMIVWGMSDHKTVWYSRDEDRSTIIKVNLESQQVFYMGSFSKEISCVAMNARHLVLSSDQLYHIDPKNGREFQCMTLEEEGFKVRQLWLNQDILISYGQEKDLAELVVWDMVSQKQDSFKIEPCVIQDLCFIDSERFAMICQDTKSYERDLFYRPMSRGSKREIDVYSLLMKKRIKTESYPFASILKKVTDQILMVSYFGFYKLELLNTKSWKTIKVIKAGMINDIEVLNRHSIVLASFDGGCFIPLSYSLRFLSLFEEEGFFVDESKANIAPDDLNLKWGQLTHFENRKNFKIYDFASENKDPVEISI
ncbi:MAG: hypothetical protein K940chlam3_00881 [Chlamydiae bacterium]|nr:hypothetical protein [Chlamydiota bacterium]